MENNNPTEILAIRNLTKTFDETVALDHVNFTLRAGEVHCLVGENGAGKSTLIKILAGAERPDSGAIVVFDKEHRYLSPDESLQLGIATIYQDLELITSLTVSDNIFLGREIVTRLGTVDYTAQNRRASELLESMNITISPAAIVETLSPAHQQTLQIVKALHINARIMIMDEPTASLGIEETKALLDLVRKLTTRQIGVIYISHYLQEIFEIGDRVTVLKDGKTVQTLAIANTEIGTITKHMIGREQSLFANRNSTARSDIVLQVRHLGRRDHFADVSFDLHRGEILGFGGVIGAGRTELMNVIFGVERRDSGEIRLHGHPLNCDSPRNAIERGVVMIPEDRKLLALFDVRSVLENIVVVDNEINRFWLKLGKEARAVQELIQRLHIVTAGTDQTLRSLSGGNQQKAVLARWLLTKGAVFIFDEPTRGVDIGAKEQIYELMAALVKEGKSILLVSSELPELLAMSDRIAIMRSGRLVATLDARQTTQRQLLALFLGFNDSGEFTA
jgi:ribose transport system ATP-binding protein